jgi:hypothetical protein
MMRVNQTITTGGVFVVDLGTNDMGNTSFANRWQPICHVLNEGTGSTKSATFSWVAGTHSQYNINSLTDSGVTFHVRLNF